MAEKRIRSMEEIVAEGEDRISELPDSIIAHILSLISSTPEAIRTSVLSKRWRYVWTSITVLIIREPEDLRDYNGEFFSSVDRTLALRGPNKLQKFAFITFRGWYIQQHYSHINQWISYALYCNVEELIIRGFPLKCDALSKSPEHLFRNSCLKKLYLDHCYCDWELIGEINWKNLKSLHIVCGRLTRKSISKVLSGSPSLETLELSFVCGFHVLNITSTSLRKLIVDKHCSHCGIEIHKLKINAPNVLSLEIKDITSEIILGDVGSIVEATLDFKVRKGKGKVMLKRMIESLKHVNELKFGVNCLEDLMSLEMKNWSSPISRCKYLQINLVKDEQEIECLAPTPPLVFMNECASVFVRPDNEIIWFMLDNASVLEKIVIRASPKCGPEAELLQSLLKLQLHRVSKEELTIVLEMLN